MKTRSQKRIVADVVAEKPKLKTTVKKYRSKIDSKKPEGRNENVVRTLNKDIRSKKVVNLPSTNGIDTTPLMTRSQKRFIPEELNRKSDKTDSRSKIDSKESPAKSMTKRIRSKKDLFIAEQSSDYRVFITGDLVWAKLRGWPAWPAKVSILHIFFP